MAKEAEAAPKDKPEPDPPTATGLSPATIDGEVELTITGTGFTDTSIVCFAGLDQPTQFVSETELKIKARPPGIGSYPVVVKTGELATPPLNFEVKGLAVGMEPAAKEAKSSPHSNAKSAPSKAEK